MADTLNHYPDREEVIVLALPRGGVANGLEIAKRLKRHLDILRVRKTEFPDQPELAIGAVVEAGALVLNDGIISTGEVPNEYINQEAERQREEIERRKELNRDGEAIVSLHGKTVILVNGGVTTDAANLFERPCALEEVSRFAARWFLNHLSELFQIDYTIPSHILMVVI